MIAGVLLLVAVAGLCGASIFLGLVLVAALRFRNHPPEKQVFDFSQFPPVSVLKPLHGDEPRLRDNLESFFRQDYAGYELIFGARHDSDPALQFVRQLQQQYPGHLVKIVLSGEPTWPNAKVCTLMRMLEAASYEYLVISDSDVHVEPRYLQQVVAPLLDPDVGLVTCVYRGVSTGGFWSRLESLGMSVEMTSGVLVANMLEGMKFALGPTMATRKDVVQKVGGFRALAEYCADDYVLGQLVDASKKEVVLSRHVINHVVLHSSMRQSLLHQARWMKSTRFSRPMGHLGSGVTFAVSFGLLGLLAGLLRHQPGLGLALLGQAMANRVLLAIFVGWATGDQDSLRYCWLYPVRDLLGFGLWCYSFLGTTIIWRGESYRLARGGYMIRAVGEPARPSNSGRSGCGDDEDSTALRPEFPARGAPG